MKRSVSKLFLAALAAAALPLAGCGVESSDPASEAEPLGSTRDELVSAGCSDPATCEDVTLNLVLDYVPQDTSWTITNSSSVVVASGDGYTAPGATVTEVIALDPGDYTFTIYASPIYGLCCWTGWGSYQLIDSSNHILASGATFDLVESTPFTISPPPPPCSPAGTSCAVGSECCSGNCARNHTCR
ncbi:MAG: hypothetical protein IT372_08165 [Polyangiaceae bacterium]|nr:hypothetical protein [Polyangiaceae bacterium]